MNTKILVATHKPYRFPDNELYEPIHVGKILSNDDFGYIGDETGENISSKNPNYSELTALYWAWKNHYFDSYDYCGLVHYRRYFKGSLLFETDSILSNKEIGIYLKDVDVLLPKKRNYYIETVRTHYVNAHYIHDLEMTREIISQQHPEYIEAFDFLMKQRKLHLSNMFVMKREHFDQYMKWLFDILFKLEKSVNISDYDGYQGRIFGFISERLFNVWLVHNQLLIKEIKMVHMEGENLLLKASGLLKRKLLR